MKPETGKCLYLTRKAINVFIQCSTDRITNISMILNPFSVPFYIHSLLDTPFSTLSSLDLSVSYLLAILSNLSFIVYIHIHPYSCPAVLYVRVQAGMVVPISLIVLETLNLSLIELLSASGIYILRSIV